jgi:hypothetical protein
MNGDPIMTVYSIDNGFILQFSKRKGELDILVYAKDEKEIASQIIAQKARLVLEGPEQREMFEAKQMAPSSRQTTAIPQVAK